MTAFETELQKLGLSEKEVAIYLTLLTHGPSSVRKLAGISKINRGTTYDVLKNLKERGLVCFYHEDTKQCFVAEDPSKLKQLVGERQQELERTASALIDIIPELRSLHDSGSDKPVVRYYEGSSGVRTILNDVLDSMVESNTREYYVYSSSAVKEAGLYAPFPDYTTERIDRGISCKTISLGPGGEAPDYSQRKWIENTEGTPTYILVYASKVANISLSPGGGLFGVIIENRGLYETQKFLFEQLWKLI